MARRTPERPAIEPRQFRTKDEIDAGIAKLERRIAEVQQLDMKAAVFQDSGTDDLVLGNVRETLRTVFGPNSPEFVEYKRFSFLVGDVDYAMRPQTILASKERGKAQLVVILNGLIDRLREAREELAGGLSPTPPLVSFDRLELHPRIADVARDLFTDGHHWEAVFAGAKALVNYVKDRSGKYEIDGAHLMRTVFSRQNPILTFSDFGSQTDQDEQEGMMHLFEGAVLAIRNPGGHSFPDGSQRRALEYLALLSLLAHRVEEAKRTN